MKKLYIKVIYFLCDILHLLSIKIVVERVMLIYVRRPELIEKRAKLIDKAMTVGDLTRLNIWTKKLLKFKQELDKIRGLNRKIRYDQKPDEAMEKKIKKLVEEEKNYDKLKRELL